MVYHPVNPTFGGNPLNGSFLLSTAQAQGEGAKSGAQSPDLSGLTNALSNLGSTIVVAPTTTGTSGNSGNTTP
jgi:curli production assembly/transport component CsgF